MSMRDRGDEDEDDSSLDILCASMTPRRSRNLVTAANQSVEVINSGTVQRRSTDDVDANRSEVGDAFARHLKPGGRGEKAKVDGKRRRPSANSDVQQSEIVGSKPKQRSRRRRRHQRPEVLVMLENEDDANPSRKRPREKESHDAQAFAEKMRIRLIEEIDDPHKQKKHLLDSGLMIDGPGPRPIMNPEIASTRFGRRMAAIEAKTPLSAIDDVAANFKKRKALMLMPPSIDREGTVTTRSRAPVTCDDESQARAMVAEMLMRPVENPEAQIIGAEHVCTFECEFRPAIETCGYGGCETLAIQAMDLADRIMTREERAKLNPDDVWVCTTGGNVHICTAEKCDSCECDSQGAIVCWKTNKSYGCAAIPEFDSGTGRADATSGETSYRIGGEAYRARAQTYLASSVLGPTPRRAPSAEIAGLSSSLETKVRRGVTAVEREEQRQDLRLVDRSARAGAVGNGIGVVGVAAPVVSRALDLALAKFSPSSVSEAGGSRPESISAMTVAKARARTSALQSAFGCDVDWTAPQQHQQQPARDSDSTTRATAEMRLRRAAAEARRVRLEEAMAASYVKSMQLAAVVVVSLPMSKKSLPLTDERAAEFTRCYGELIWRAWTLAMASPTRCPVETETRFKQFAFGTMYQAKNGYAVPFDVTTVEEYMADPAPVDAAIDVEYYAEHPDERRDGDGSSSSAERRSWFAKRHAIGFLKVDKYLVGRLVSENHVGQKGTVVDGIATESVGVNGGISLVEEALSEIAEWSKRRFVFDAHQLAATAARQTEEVDDTAERRSMEIVAKIKDRSRVIRIS